MHIVNLIQEIEDGVLAAALAPHWNNVFEAPADVDPKEPSFDDEKSRARALKEKSKDTESEEHRQWRATMSSRNVKRGRAGVLHPDAAHAIHQLLSQQPAQILAKEHLARIAESLQKHRDAFPLEAVGTRDFTPASLSSWDEKFLSIREALRVQSLKVLQLDDILAAKAAATTEARRAR